MKRKNTINLGGDNFVTTDAIKAVVELQKNNCEDLYGHIAALGDVALWIGVQLDGFDPEDTFDPKLLQLLVSVSNVAAMLRKFEVK